MNLIFGGTNSAPLAKEIALRSKSQHAIMRVNHFPDGELYIRFMSSVKQKNIVIVNSMQPNPQEALGEILFAALTARAQGAKKIVLIIPYMGFMRQDKQFHTGESVSSQSMGFLLSKVADKIITIDPHLHRYHSLSQVFSIPAIHLSAVSALAQHIKEHWTRATIIGPDGESNQWATAVAKIADCGVVIVKKKRYTANKVRTKLVDSGFKDKTVIIVDDIISTGHTMHEVVKQLRAIGAAHIICMGVHGVFASGALVRLQKAGAQVITTDTIINPTSKISVATLLAEAIQ